MSTSHAISRSVPATDGDAEETSFGGRPIAGGKEINDVLDERKIQFCGGSGGRCCGCGLVVCLGGRGPADDAGFERQRSPGHQSGAEAVRSIDFSIDAAANTAFAKQSRFHVAAFHDDPEPVGQSANQQPLATEHPDQQEQFTWDTRQLFFEPKPDAQHTAQHQSVRTRRALDAQPVVLGSLAKRFDNSETAVDQQAESVEFAGPDHLGLAFSEPLDPLKRSDSDNRLAIVSLGPGNLAEYADHAEPGPFAPR